MNAQDRRQVLIVAAQEAEPVVPLPVGPIQQIDGVEQNAPIWSLQPLCEGGVALNVERSKAHELKVLHWIVKQVYETALPKLSSESNEFGQEKETFSTDNAKKFLDNFKNAVQLYQKTNPGSCLLESSQTDWSSPQCQFDCAIEIGNYCYHMAVPHVEDLNKYYKTFSAGVYGECNLDFLATILGRLNLNKDDVFVDLGSGIGQIVTFVASYCQIKKAVGIELSDFLEPLFSANADSFRRLMSHFNKEFSPFELFHGDFLAERFRDVICSQATVIFMNNYAFDNGLMEEIVHKLLNFCKDGTRIVTSQRLITKRDESTRPASRGTRYHDVEFSSIFLQQIVDGVKGNVSWGDTPVDFTIYKIDHGQFERNLTAQDEKMGNLRTEDKENAKKPLERRRGQQRTGKSTVPAKKRQRKGK